MSFNYDKYIERKNEYEDFKKDSDPFEVKLYCSECGRKLEKRIKYKLVRGCLRDIVVYECPICDN